MKKYQIPMIVTNEVIRDFNIPREEVISKRIGRTVKQVVMVDATEEEYKAYMRYEWAEFKREERELRCHVLGKKGKLIRCPDGNDCNKCPFQEGKDLHMGVTTSLDVMQDTVVEPAAPGSLEDDVHLSMVMEQILQTLEALHPDYADIFRLMCDGASDYKIADELGLRPRTVNKYKNIIRKLLRPIAENFL